MNNKTNRINKNREVSVIQKGFTLIELMVVVAIIGIGATVSFNGAGPGSFFRSDAQISSVKSRFHNAVKYARALAILSRKEVCIKNNIVGNKAKMIYCTDPAIPSTAARAYLVYQKLNALMAKEIKLPSGSNTITSTDMKFNRIGMRIAGNNIFEFKNVKDGDTERYLVEVSLAGTSKSCKVLGNINKCN